MSLMALKKGFEKHGPIWGGILAFIMLAGVVFSGFGANVSTGADPSGGDAGKPVAKVGETEVTREMLDLRLKQVLDQNAMMGQFATPGPAEKARYRAMLLSSFQQEQALAKAAQKAGVTITDADIARVRDEVWQQSREQFAATLGLKAGATDAEINAELNKQSPGLTVERLKVERIPEDKVRLQLYKQGLTDVLKKQISVTEEEVKDSYSEIQVRHILIKSGEGGLPEAQAKAKAEKVLKEVQADPSKLAELAKKYSDDPGSKDKGGLYDWAPGSQYVPEFTRGALAAGVGKVNPEPIKTSYGYHIIKLEGKRPGKDLPKDWDKEKAKHIADYQDRLAQQKVSEAITAELATVPVEVTDPLLKAAQVLAEVASSPDEKARNAAYEQALGELAKVKPEDDTEGAAALLKAEAYQALKRTPEAIASYEEALNYGNTAEIRLALAQLYMTNKDKTNALKQVDEAENLAIPNIQMQMQLGMLLEQLGEKERAKKAMDKANEMMKRMSAQMATGSGAATDTPPAGTPPAGTPATAPQPAPSPDAKASPTAGN